MVTSNNRRGYHNQGKGRSFAPRGQNFKRGGYAQQPQQGLNNFRRNNNNNHQGRRYGKQPQNDLT
ncbi:hypothetical protein PIB30_115906, partial [Stylosanthes scabra]|nr:hypothetical protein [Stylosanthes scabra]